jgi:hypothetical protein
MMPRQSGDIVTALLVIAWVVIGFIAGAIGLTELFHIPAMEGQAGYFAMMIGGPIGALCGAGIGYLLSRHYADRPQAFRVALGASWLAIVLFFGGSFAVEMARTWDKLDSSGGENDLSWRVRLPPGAPWPAGQKAGFELRSEKENVACSMYDAPHGTAREEERFIFNGSCKLRYATPKRELWFRIGGGPNLIFRLRIPARYEVVPYSVSAWYKVDEVLDIAEGSKRRPPRPEEAGYEVLLSAR